MSRRFARLAMLSLAVALAAPMSAQAQLGGLMKRAKKAVQQEQDPTSGSGLTDPMVRAVLKGLEAQLPILNQRDALSKQRDAAVTERSKLFDAHPGEGEAYSDADQKNSICLDSVLTQISDAHQAGMNAMGQQMASDPQKRAAMMQEMMAMQQKAQQMMQAGDTAGAVRLQKEFGEKMSGIDPKADTLQAIKACGAPPTKPAWLARADADADQADTLNARMQRLEEQANSSGVSASGLPAEQFAQARERIATWYGQQGGPYANQGFTPAEVKVLRAHQAEIAKLESIL